MIMSFIRTRILIPLAEFFGQIGCDQSGDISNNE